MILMFSSSGSKCVSYSKKRFVLDQVGKSIGGGSNVFNVDVLDCNPLVNRMSVGKKEKKIGQTMYYVYEI